MATGPTVSASRSSLVYKSKYHYILMRTSEIYVFTHLDPRELGHLKIKDFARTFSALIFANYLLILNL